MCPGPRWAQMAILGQMGSIGPWNWASQSQSFCSVAPYIHMTADKYFYTWNLLNWGDLRRDFQKPFTVRSLPGSFWASGLRGCLQDCYGGRFHCLLCCLQRSKAAYGVAYGAAYGGATFRTIPEGLPETLRKLPGLRKNNNSQQASGKLLETFWNISDTEKRQTRLPVSLQKPSGAFQNSVKLKLLCVCQCVFVCLQKLA